MSSKNQLVGSSVAVLFAIMAILGIALTPTASTADSTGTLKLKINQCQSVQWISGARVDVVVTRLNVGQIDSATGCTDSDGYVEFTFTNLEGQDEANVTVTPSGESADNSHHYYWSAGNLRVSGWWDLGASPSSLGCSDTWYDQGNDIIKCQYRSN